MKTRNIILCITICIVFFGCIESEDHTQIPRKQSLIGSWRVDSVHPELTPEEHSRIQAIEFKENDVTWFSYFHRHNRVFKYTSKRGYTLKNSTLNYMIDSSAYQLLENEGLFNVELIGADRLKMSAKFITSYSIPPEDSVIYYSRVADAEDYLNEFVRDDMTSNRMCNDVDPKLIEGFWSLDSMEYSNRTETQGNYIVYFDSQETMCAFNLGKRNSYRFFNYSIKDGALDIYGKTIPLLCLSKERMIYREDSFENYIAVYHTRINPDSIIPDSLRVDRTEIKNLLQHEV